MTVLAPTGFSGCGVALLCDVSGSVAKDAAGAVLSTMTAALASTAGWVVGHLVDLAVAPTDIDLGAGWFAAREQAMLAVVTVVVMPVLLAASIGPVLRQDGRGLVRVWLVGLPTSLLAGFLGVQLVEIGLAVSDQLCGIIAGGSAWRFAGRFVVLVDAGAIAGAPTLVTAVVSVLLIAGGVLVWLELLVRAAAVYIAVFFMPLALVGFIWPATAAVAKRTVELLVALIMSKFVIIAALTLGSAALSPSSTADAAVTGGAILLLAGFAPFVLLRLAPIVEFAAMAHLEGVARRPVQLATRAFESVGTMHNTAAVLRSLGGNVSGPDADRLVGATPVPEREAEFPLPSESPGDPPASRVTQPAGGGSAGSDPSPEAGSPVSAATIPERAPDFPLPSGSVFGSVTGTEESEPSGDGSDGDG
jgi:hypothetical protein